MKRTKGLQGRGKFLLGAMALALAVFLGLFADGFSAVSYAAGKGTVTTANGAKIRKEATSSSEMVGSAVYNKEVTINSSVQGSDGYTWYQVTVDGVEGYIRSDLVKTSDDSTGTTTNTNETPAEVTAVNPVSATVKGGQSVRIRSNASTTSQIVTTAASGVAVTVTGQATGTDGKTWYQVSFISDGSSVEGFIREDYVELSEEVTPYTEEPDVPEEPAENEPETTSEPEEQKAYETVLKDGDWYLVITETNEGYVIQDIFDKMASNVEEYDKLAKTSKTQKIVIILLVILLVVAASGVALLIFKLKDMADAQYFNEVERETLRKREPAKAGGQKVMHTVGAEKQGTRPAGAAQGARPAGARPAGAGQGARTAGGTQGARPVGTAQGTRPAGTAQGARPAGAGQGARPAQGTRPAGAAQGARPAGTNNAGTSQAQQARREARLAADARPAPQQGRSAKETRMPQPKQGNTQSGWQAKNFMADDDDEFEFEFLNYDGEDEE